MLFDPFTMIAQLINFVVLVVALRHFLYKPVIDAMDERENKIAQRLTDADEREHDQDGNGHEDAGHAVHRRPHRGLIHHLVEDGKANIDNAGRRQGLTQARRVAGNLA